MALTAFFVNLSKIAFGTIRQALVCHIQVEAAMEGHLEILKKFVTLSGTVVKVDIIFWFFQILDFKYFFEWQPNMQSR